MMIQINEETYNAYSLLYFYPQDKNSKYYILYRLSNGQLLEEEFDTESDRNSKLDEVAAISGGGGGGDVSGKEDKANKVTSINNQSTDTQYPSAKCTYDTIVANAVSFKPFPNTFNTTGTTQQFLSSVTSQNLPSGMVYLGQVSLSDMPDGVSVQAEVEVYIYPQNVAYCVMRSAEVYPYVWECNSYSFRGWEPVQADTSMIAPSYDSTNTYAEGDYVTHNGTLYVCNTTISQAEVWTPAHWTSTTIVSTLGDIESLLSEV